MTAFKPGASPPLVRSPILIPTLWGMSGAAPFSRVPMFGDRMRLNKRSRGHYSSIECVTNATSAFPQSGEHLVMTDAPVAATPVGSVPGKTLGIVGLVLDFIFPLLGLILSIVAKSQ